MNNRTSGNEPRWTIRIQSWQCFGKFVCRTGDFTDQRTSGSEINKPVLLLWQQTDRQTQCLETPPGLGSHEEHRSQWESFNKLSKNLNPTANIEADENLHLHGFFLPTSHNPRRSITWFNCYEIRRKDLGTSDSFRLRSIVRQSKT